MGLTGLVPHSILNGKFQNDGKQPIKPKKLQKGALIGLVAPGYAIKQEVLNNAIDTLEQMGFMVYNTPRLLGNHGYFSNTDAERAKDLNHMFANPEVDAILCARGGYGSTRILDLLDYDTITKNPKPLIGFSDITALLNPIYQKTGLVGFHGPVGSTLDDPYSQEYLTKVLMEPQEKLTITNFVDTQGEFGGKTEFERYTITSGKATGTLVGGNMTLVSVLMGTPYEIDFTDKLVFLEDVEEGPYRIDRMLTQLRDNPTFAKAKGLLFGVCNGCDKPKTKDNFTLKEVIMDRVAPLGIPAAYGMSFGHVTNNFTLPIGIKAEFDADNMSLTLLEPAVV